MVTLGKKLKMQKKMLKTFLQDIAVCDFAYFFLLSENCFPFVDLEGFLKSNSCLPGVSSSQFQRKGDVE